MKKNNYIFLIVMTVIIGIIVLLAFFGPLRQAFNSRTDTLIENNLSEVTRGINTYYSSNNELPKSLNDITLNGDAKELVTQNLVEYIPEDDMYYPLGYSESDNSKSLYNEPQAKYQLCVTYVSDNTSSYSYAENTNEYTEYLSAYYHPAGRTCYKLLTTAY